MSRKRTKIVKELDPQEVEGFSQARINHYLSLGYKPYLDEKSHVKWLTQAQLGMRDAVTRHRPFRIQRPPHYIRKKHRRRWMRPSLWHIVCSSWPFLLLLGILAVGVALMLIRPNILF
ncbi:MAG: hypothetical protein PHO85_01500 [Candidatus Cloacimonetes bacterium]|jgi:hypothetical protein|nr:hypothetical protein [Candidatus Cloacimonadota bacterium]MDD2506752.1 hypothetical protein [Candidatus Cloacimonadota bacterium]MDD4147175.1 hypothetical protein [Candidatus Cloacimonadota bacterium]MDD4559380.1 hypothetical protein [Candidatus Cloacimonadota bacterium]